MNDEYRRGYQNGLDRNRQWQDFRENLNLVWAAFLWFAVGNLCFVGMIAIGTLYGIAAEYLWEWYAALWGMLL